MQYKSSSEFTKKLPSCINNHTLHPSPRSPTTMNFTTINLNLAFSSIRILKIMLKSFSTAGCPVTEGVAVHHGYMTWSTVFSVPQCYLSKIPVPMFLATCFIHPQAIEPFMLTNNLLTMIVPPHNHSIRLYLL